MDPITLAVMSSGFKIDGFGKFSDPQGKLIVFRKKLFFLKQTFLSKIFMGKFGYFSFFLTAISFDDQKKVINQNFSCVFVVAAPKIDRFVNPLLEFDGFGRTRPDDITD